MSSLLADAGYEIEKNTKLTLTDTKVATITKAGLVTGKKAGSAEILFDKEETGICVNVELPAFDEKTVTLSYIGQTCDSAANLTGVSGAEPSWEIPSSNSVVSIDPNSGIVTAQKKGSVKVSAVFANVGAKGQVKFSYTVKVNIPVLSKTTLKVLTGATAKLTVKNVAKTQTVSWVSSNESVVRVEYKPGENKAVVRPVASGDATVSAVVDGHSYPCEVTVPVPATKKTVYYVKAGKTASIALKDTKLKVKQFVWTSGDPAVATAGEHTGKVTGVAGGMTTIYGTYTDEATGGKVVVYCGVEVSSPIATSGDVNQYEQYWGNFNIKAVSNGPKQSTVFTVGSDGLFLQAIRTYHYNKGNGATPGTITIKKGSKTIGVYQANGNTGNSFWDVFPNIYLDAGTYTIIDSGKSTWSYNADSGNAGFAIVYGTTP